MELVELLLQKAVGIDDEGCIEELFILPSGYGANGIHLVLTALLLYGLEGW